MENTVITKSFPSPEVNIKEIMRYSRIGELTPDMEKLISECYSEAKDSFSYNVCYRILPIMAEDGVVDFGFFKAESHHLEKALGGFCYAAVFAASVGMGIDRLIKKYSHISPAKSVIFQAIGAERAESLCDVFCREIATEYKNVGKRFSPGYGDLSLELQREIFSLLDCKKYIGVSLGDNLLMSPSKSVTAIMGIDK